MNITRTPLSDHSPARLSVFAAYSAAWDVKAFQVDSDSGKRYLVHVLVDKVREPKAVHVLCTCPDCTFNLPLVVMGAHYCKHAQAVLHQIGTPQ